MEDPGFEFDILESVEADKGSLTQRSISKRVGRSVSSVNFALRLLAAKGYIKISGANPRKLRYSLTPQGVIRKSVLAYNFLVRQSNLYDEVRNGLIKKLKNVSARRVKTVSVYGWTPFTETAILFLVLEGIVIQAIYVKRSEDIKNLQKWNRIPVRLLDDFEPESEVLILMEMLPRAAKQLLQIETVECFPEA